jgi:hypothetical protein
VLRGEDHGAFGLVLHVPDTHRSGGPTSAGVQEGGGSLLSELYHGGAPGPCMVSTKRSLQPA